MHDLEFLEKQLHGIWRVHFNAQFTSYCCKPQGCGGLVRPGQHYYRNDRGHNTIHCDCAKKWREKETASAEL